MSRQRAVPSDASWTVVLNPEGQLTWQVKRAGGKPEIELSVQRTGMPRKSRSSATAIWQRVSEWLSEALLPELRLVLKPGMQLVLLVGCTSV